MIIWFFIYLNIVIVLFEGFLTIDERTKGKEEVVESINEDKDETYNI